MSPNFSTPTNHDALGCANEPVVLLVIAKGAENAVVARDGALPIGLTRMTGTRVKFAQQVADAAAFGHVGPGGLWIAKGTAFVLSIADWRPDDRVTA